MPGEQSFSQFNDMVRNRSPYNLYFSAASPCNEGDAFPCQYSHAVFHGMA